MGRNKHLCLGQHLCVKNRFQKFGCTVRAGVLHLSAGYMLNKLKVPKEGIEARGALWYNDYGTTMAGLRVRVLSSDNLTSWEGGTVALRGLG